MLIRAAVELSKLDIYPIPGEELKKVVAGLFKLEPGMVARLKEVLVPK